MSWDVIGQERAVAVLRRAVEEEGRLSHAYLFAGPERVGRSTTARAFAQALNCSARIAAQAEAGGAFSDLGATGVGRPVSLQAPCGDCRSCRLIAEDKHPDVEWVGVGGVCEESEHRDHSADGSHDIRICQVRRLERVVSRTPFEGRYRVVVIDPADALTTEAANAFLKTLEEPPPRVVLVLITAREEMLPETVRSRCRRIAFCGVPRQAIEGALRQRWGVEPNEASRLARLAQGRLGWAVAALEDEGLLAARERAFDDLETVLRGGVAERFSCAASLGARFMSDPAEVSATLESWRDWWRDVLVASAGQEALVATSERLDTLRSQAAQYGVGGSVQALKSVLDARRHLEEHASPTLALEVMLLELPPEEGR